MNDLLIPQDELNRQSILLSACEWIDKQSHGVMRSVAMAAVDASKRLGKHLSAKSMERYYYAYKKQGKDALINKNRLPQNRRSRTRDSRFIAYLGSLAVKNQRCSVAAIEQLYQYWSQGVSIPGYEGMNPYRGMPLPKGWSKRNLLDLMPDKRTLSLHRQGTQASAGMMAQTFSTRAGLWPCSHVLFDDVWLDMLISGYGDDGRAQLGRPLQLGALDYFTGKRLCWGTKLRTKREDGTHKGLNKDDMTMLVVQYLSEVGYSPRGTVLVVENGTAAISKELEERIAQVTDGLVRVDRSGIIGKRQVGVDGGAGKGNPRHKAALEQWHSLLHNRMADFGLQTGHDRTEPEMLSGARKRIEHDMKDLAKMDDYTQAMYTATVPNMMQLAERLAQTVGGIDRRTEHSLEGWNACGFEVDEYSFNGRDGWTDAHLLNADGLAAAQALAQVRPTCYRRRQMSPQEAWEASLRLKSNQLIRINARAAVLLMGTAGKFKLRKEQGGCFTLDSRKRHHYQLQYETCVVTPEGYELELPYGAEYYGIFNPYGEQLIVLDAKERVLGMARRQHRVQLLTPEAKYEAWGRQNKRNAAQLAHARSVAAPDIAQQRIQVAYNDDLLAGKVLNPLEVADEKTIQKAAKASKKRKAASAQPSRRQAPAAPLPSLTPREGLAAQAWPSQAPAPPPAQSSPSWGIPQSTPQGSFL